MSIRRLRIMDLSTTEQFGFGAVQTLAAADAVEGLCRGMLLDPAENPEDSNW